MMSRHHPTFATRRDAERLHQTSNLEATSSQGADSEPTPQSSIWWELPLQHSSRDASHSYILTDQAQALASRRMRFYSQQPPTRQLLPCCKVGYERRLAASNNHVKHPPARGQQMGYLCTDNGAVPEATVQGNLDVTVRTRSIRRLKPELHCERTITRCATACKQTIAVLCHDGRIRHSTSYFTLTSARCQELQCRVTRM